MICYLAVVVEWSTSSIPSQRPLRRKPYILHSEVQPNPSYRFPYSPHCVYVPILAPSRRPISSLAKSQLTFSRHLDGYLMNEENPAKRPKTWNKQRAGVPQNGVSRSLATSSIQVADLFAFPTEVNLWELDRHPAYASCFRSFELELKNESRPFQRELADVHYSRPVIIANISVHILSTHIICQGSDRYAE